LFASRQAIVDVPPMVRRGIGGIDAADFHRVDRLENLVDLGPAIMPKTYAGLRARRHLGPDAYNPRDNILAGAAYLREMLERYGSPGFLAAYNAGPARYDEHLATGRSLPPETRVHIAILSQVISGR
jgi:hypothetical protein